MFAAHAGGRRFLPRTPAACGRRLWRLWIAACWCSGSVRISAQGSQPGVGIGDTDHRVRTSLVFTVERSGFSGVEATRYGVLRIVEPEADMKSVGRGKGEIRVKPKDLVQEDSFDPHVAVIGLIADLDIGLIPSQAEVCEVWIWSSVREERTPLHGEEIKRKAWLNSIQIQD